MDIKFRTITGKIYTLNEISPKTTVGQMKENLAKQNPGLNAKQLHFILPAGSLADETTFDKLNIQPETYIILHQTNSCSLADMVLSQTQVRRPSTPSLNDTSSSAPNQKTHKKSKDFQSIPQPPPPDDSLALLVEMGFDQEMCQRALTACHGNIENAANMLLSGSTTSCNAPANEPEVDIDTLFNSLSSNEKSIVQRLTNEFTFNQETVLQVFLACDKNESVTHSCLKNMDS